MDVRSGGTATTALLLAHGQRMAGMDAELLCCRSRGGERIAEREYIHFMGDPRNGFYYTPHIEGHLRSHSDADLYHLHGVWQYPALAAARFARRRGKPYLITPHGMLYPQDMAKGRLKKRAYMELLLRKDLRRAACLHATARQEMDHLRALGIASPVAVIPNPVDTSGLDAPLPSPDRFRVGYLGRVAPRKRIERLLQAWKGLDMADGELVVVGDGEGAYMEFLKGEARRLGLKNVRFTGFLQGEAKRRELASMSVLAMPSDFENFGNSAAEALVAGVPVIATRGAPWRELSERECGWWVGADEISISAAIAAAAALSPEDRVRMGSNGRALMADRYSVEAVSGLFADLYRWILDGGAPPQTVYVM